MLKFLRVSVVIGLVSLFFGCAATALHPGAERIIVSKKDAPKGCKFMGAVVGEQGGSFTGAYTSNKALAQGSLNDMRNRALELGANYVQLETDRAGQTGSSGKYSGHLGQTDVTMTGNAYHCPPEEIGL
ncbi:MAG: DUF4156 domain-containing protein [Bdellovibrio sp.]|nr:DUF4156 domain-containing protein [Bdellovibrio sp.]